MQEHVAVIGSGVSGIVSAYLWSKKAKVTMYEARNRLGGHTHTHAFEYHNKPYHIDSGFIVLNDRTYPTLHRFFEKLGVHVRSSDMSFSYYDENSKQYYAGNNLNGVFSRRRNLLSPQYYLFLKNIFSFGKQALRDLEKGINLNVSLFEYLNTAGASSALIHQYILPMVASIWSAPDHTVMEHPAFAILSFMKHHGLLDLMDRPQWQTVVGGSHTYIHAFLDQTSVDTKPNTPIQSIQRGEKHVTIHTQEGQSKTFDRVILACHADQVLDIIEKPHPWEREFFSTWTYEPNHVTLHNDESLLPPKKRAWAAWNYLKKQTAQNQKLVMTYNMNILQGLTSEKHFLVTLNAQQYVNPTSIIKEVTYQHPIFTQANLQARDTFVKTHPVDDLIQYVGSYFGFGFHEDGAKSATKIGKAHGLTL